VAALRRPEPRRERGPPPSGHPDGTWIAADPLSTKVEHSAQIAVGRGPLRVSGKAPHVGRRRSGAARSAAPAGGAVLHVLARACTRPVCSAGQSSAPARPSSSSRSASVSPSTPPGSVCGWCVGGAAAGTSRLSKNGGKRSRSANGSFGAHAAGVPLSTSDGLACRAGWSWCGSVVLSVPSSPRGGTALGSACATAALRSGIDRRRDGLSPRRQHRRDGHRGSLRIAHHGCPGPALRSPTAAGGDAGDDLRGEFVPGSGEARRRGEADTVRGSAGVAPAGAPGVRSGGAGGRLGPPCDGVDIRSP
jgi:hypothetical protein